MPPPYRHPIALVGSPLPKPAGALNPTSWDTDALGKVLVALDQEVKDLRAQQKDLAVGLDGVKFKGTWDVSEDLAGRLGTAHQAMIEAYSKYIDAVEGLANRLRDTTQTKKTAEVDATTLVRTSPVAPSAASPRPADFS